MNDLPWMEHPTGEFSNAIEAMDAVIKKLRDLPAWDRWITFCAQGEGDSPETTAFAEVRVLSDILEVDRLLDLQRITHLDNVPASAISAAGTNRYSLYRATSEQAARILDAIFRYQFHIRPFPDEGNDYAVGAEW